MPGLLRPFPQGGASKVTKGKIMNSQVPLALSKSQRKRRKKVKWEHAETVRRFCNDNGFDFFMFEHNNITPHVRIGHRVDYWPASQRFYDIESKKKGLGFESLKDYLIKTLEFPSSSTVQDWLNELDQDIALAMARDGI